MPGMFKHLPLRELASKHEVTTDSLKDAFCSSLGQHFHQDEHPQDELMPDLHTRDALSLIREDPQQLLVFFLTIS